MGKLRQKEHIQAGYSFGSGVSRGSARVLFMFRFLVCKSMVFAIISMNKEIAEAT